MSSQDPKHCYHCHEPIAGECIHLPEQELAAYELQGDGGEPLASSEVGFCCIGCRAVFASIHALGCEDYYRYRTEPASRADAIAERLNGQFASDSDYSWADELLEQLDFVELVTDASSDSDDSLREAQLLLDNVRCSACAWLIENSLNRYAGVDSVNVHLINRKLVLRWRQSQTGLATLLAQLDQLGYRPSGWNQQHSWENYKQERAQAAKYLGVSGIIMMQVGMMSIGLYAGEFSGNIASSTVALLRAACFVLSSFTLYYCGKPFYRSAWQGLSNGRFNMDVPIVLALSIAYGVSIIATLRQAEHVYFDTIAMFLFFLWLSRFIECHSRGSYQASDEQGLPNLVLRRSIEQHDGQHEHEPHTVLRSSLRLGDEILCKRGDTVAADGLLLADFAELDCSAFSGESEPVRLQRQQRVHAGYINVGDPFWLQVQSEYGASSFDGLQQLASGAENARPQYQKIIDRISPYFTLTVLLVACLVGVYWWQQDPSKLVDVIIAVLIVSCPCALSLATPLAMSVANRVARQFGLVVANGNAWLQLAKVTDVVFDKTGTLTEPGQLQARVSGHQLDSQEALKIAASLESLSNHPIAAAFLKQYLLQNDSPLYTVDDFRVSDGRGIEGVVNGCRYRLGRRAWSLDVLAGSADAYDDNHGANRGEDILLAGEGGELAGFDLTETLRSDARDTLSRLQSAGYRVHIYSGDSEAKVSEAAAALAVSDYAAALQPADKLVALQNLQSDPTQKRCVLAIGDGVNDAPLLAAADVSIAVANASSMTAAKADMVQCNDQLANIAAVLGLARQARATIISNCLWALLYNSLAISFAAVGLISPYLAAIGMTLSSLVVLLNSRRLRRFAESESGAYDRSTLESISSGSSRRAMLLGGER